MGEHFGEHFGEYTPGYAADAVQMMSGRTALDRASSLIPYLCDGMRVLDIGCGPGTITLGLARAVAPGGVVVGVDAERSQVEIARTAARDAAVANATFEVASAYALPFENGSFDAAFAHGLFEHLARPEAAFIELRRVVRSGGVAALCSSDWSAAVVEPRDVDVDEALRCDLELRRRAGGDPDAGRKLAALAVAAGLDVISSERRDAIDLPYTALAAYIGDRIDAALAAGAAAELGRLAEGAAAARRWQRRADGVSTQSWVDVVARRR